MANWSTTTKHEPSSINNGRQYELRDRVSIEQLNNMTENSFYAMEASSVAKEKAEEALKFAQGSGTTVYENGSPVAEFNADKKVDKTKLEQDYYTKEEVNDLVESGSSETDLSNYYTKQETYSRQEIDDKLANLDVDIDFSDYYTKTQTDSLLSGKADKSELFSGSYNDLTNKPTIPTTASEVNALPNTTKYGASLDLTLDETNYKVTVQLKDQSGNTLGASKTIDLPLESVVVNGSYDSTNKKVVLTLQNGSEISFSVADLVSGLQTQITVNNKLGSDLITDANQINKFVTAEEKSTWNNKVDVSVDNLTNYYKKTETYTKTETANLLNGALSTKADKSEIEDFVTNEELEDKGYLTKVPDKYLDQTQIENMLSNKADKTELKNYVTVNTESAIYAPKLFKNITDNSGLELGIYDDSGAPAINVYSSTNSAYKQVFQKKAGIIALKSDITQGTNVIWREWT